MERLKVKTPEAPGATEATVSVYLVALTVTTTPEPESPGEGLLVV
jgi:hypothetical protein